MFSIYYINKFNRSLLLFLICILSSQDLAGQIQFNNGSLEDSPSDATTPTGWIPCTPGTTPDIMPGFFGVNNRPKHGKSYVGLITREGNTWEAIGQRLEIPLVKDDCYSLTFYYAHSTIYATYDQPVRLRIWGSQERCTKEQLLGEIDKIDNTYWKKGQIDFTPKEDVKFIIFEAYYLNDKPPYNGNLLLDKIGPIKYCHRA